MNLIRKWFPGVPILSVPVRRKQRVPVRWYTESDLRDAHVSGAMGESWEMFIKTLQK